MLSPRLPGLVFQFCCLKELDMCNLPAETSQINQHGFKNADTLMSTTVTSVQLFISMHFTHCSAKASVSVFPPGVSEYLSTEICTSRQKRFSLVTFVDSPGLVDGDMKYPFDVDEVILWLGGLLLRPEYVVLWVCRVSTQS